MYAHFGITSDNRGRLSGNMTDKNDVDVNMKEITLKDFLAKVVIGKLEIESNLLVGKTTEPEAIRSIVINSIREGMVQNHEMDRMMNCEEPVRQWEKLQ
jgi:hypothetical protein